MTENKDDFVSFEKALRELQLQSEELKKLISEGDIRAFRDGASIKFKREDVEALAQKRTGESVAFAESLEDDTGMVTEELSAEDTLLEETDVPQEESRVAKVAASAPARRAAPRIAAQEKGEPAWAIAAAIVCSLVMIYGFLVTYSIASGTPPGGLTGLFAK
ncbi:MAG: helix-turn-helix domain-containing protein [Planctomycetes bacterium]|nr:helix-turn-helix domain-containing protein [Planctomycetota bacterium]